MLLIENFRMLVYYLSLWIFNTEMSGGDYQPFQNTELILMVLYCDADRLWVPTLRNLGQNHLQFTLLL